MSKETGMAVSEALNEVYSVIEEYYHEDFTIKTPFSVMMPEDEDKRAEFEQELHKALKCLYNAVANDDYITYTKKSFDELDREGYFGYYKNDWADDLVISKVDSIYECMGCAESAADIALEHEGENYEREENDALV